MNGKNMHFTNRFGPDSSIVIGYLKALALLDHVWLRDIIR